MAKRTCSIVGCSRPQQARGWCKAHWKRWRKHGDPLGRAPRNSDFRCSVEGCDAVVDKRRMCNTHYIRVRRHGDPDYVERIRGDDEARFWSKIDVGHPLGCWEWTGHANGPFGYGRLPLENNKYRVLAHRYAFELLREPIPDGMVLDHLCRNTMCVNPDHLEVVTPAENTHRGYGPTSRNAHRRR